ncbi:MAG: Uma2 family endonuclease [Longimonas sp.]|uniref:Uma2 family endonuclease n=1 Tax=Longimonas sp. TaxID=2039626 RepID=UPI003362D303
MEPTVTATPTAPPESLPEKERYTYADYVQLPEGAPYQLINGSLVMSPSPASYHQIVHARLFLALATRVDDHNMGQVLSAPIDVKLSDTNVVQPDLVFVAQERLDVIGEQVIDGAPDLVMEVLSPSTAHHDLTTKKRLYEMHGVQEYWVVDPTSRTVEIHANTDAGFTQHVRQVESGTAASALLDGLTVKLKSLFAS